MKTFTSTIVTHLLIISFLSIGLVSCTDKKAAHHSAEIHKTHDEHEAMDLTQMPHDNADMMHRHHEEINAELPADLPVFEESVKTYSNFVNFINATNTFVRYNSKPELKSKISAFYTTQLVENGWEIHPSKSREDKLVISKKERFATVRMMDMQLGDSMTVAVTINLVEPKG